MSHLNSNRESNIIPVVLGSDESYLKIDELAKILNVKPETVMDWSRRYEDFPSINLPGSVRIRASDVMEWLKQFKKPLRKRRQEKRESNIST
jgi:predicted DNA-binding transcriptional regulator AlpA